MIEAIGWIAAGLCILVFAADSAIHARMIAIVANISFIVYGFLMTLTPVIVLHMILLPINITKIVKLRNKKQEVK